MQEQPLRGQRRAWPFYIVCDVSQSMWDPGMNPTSALTPYHVMSNTLPDMIRQLQEDPTSRDTAHLCVVAFGDEVEEVNRLTHLRDGAIHLPPLPKSGRTNYTKVFQFLNDHIRSSIVRLRKQGFKPRSPIIFFITDGNPSANDWTFQRERLGDPAFEERPVIVSFGLGEVTDTVVARIASLSPEGAACIAENGAEPSELLEAIIGIIQFSISQSTNRGDFVFRVPKGMRRIALR